MRVLVVDDDQELSTLISKALVRDGWVTRIAGTTAEARSAVASWTPDALVLDLGLPDGSGLELCALLRGQRVATPILMLTAHNEVAIRVQGLDAGADDFLAKPFAIAELRARLRALLRRGPSLRGQVVRLGDVSLDVGARRAERRGIETRLTSREWSVLEVLARRPGIVPRSEILESVWGEATPALSATLEVLVGRVRRKLGEGLLRTQRGHGYELARD